MIVEYVLEVECTFMSRVAYFLAGLLALYAVVAPFVSHFPNLRPLVMTTALSLGAVSLLLAAMDVPHGRKSLLALLGSGAVLACYLDMLVISPILRKLGFVHVRTQAVAVEANLFDTWRPLLDRPAWWLLLAFSVAAFCLAFVSMRGKRYQ